MSAETWQAAVTALGEQLKAAAERNEWDDFAAQFERYSTLLRAAPADDNASLTTILLEARSQIAQFLTASQHARTQVADQLRGIGRGRRAVDAYR